MDSKISLGFIFFQKKLERLWAQCRIDREGKGSIESSEAKDGILNTMIIVVGRGTAAQWINSNGLQIK